MNSCEAPRELSGDERCVPRRTRGDDLNASDEEGGDLPVMTEFDEEDFGGAEFLGLDSSKRQHKPRGGLVFLR